jgi:hypothetical protein
MRFQNFFKWQYNALSPNYVLVASFFVINCVNAHQRQLLSHEEVIGRWRWAPGRHCLSFAAMIWQGNLRKLLIEPGNMDSTLQYTLAGADVLNPLPAFRLSECIGHHVQLTFSGQIHCAATGKSIRKTYGDGLSYDAWMKAPEAVASVIHPELSRIHEGVALRDREWEEAHHNVPHWVYLATTSTIKVGVTGAHTGAKRWFDQGAIAGTVLCIAPYRRLAGEMEVLLKEIFPDKSAYRAMILATDPDLDALQEAREEAFEHLGDAFASYMQFDAGMETFHYPQLTLPKAVRSVRLDKQPRVEGVLVALKGQYAVFDTGEVVNIRSHIGYRVELRIN